MTKEVGLWCMSINVKNKFLHLVVIVNNLCSGLFDPDSVDLLHLPRVCGHPTPAFYDQ